MTVTPEHVPEIDHPVRGNVVIPVYGEMLGLSEADLAVLNKGGVV